MIQETRDPLDNVVTVVTKDKTDKTVIALDYRVLQPWLVTDPNNNRSAIAFDVLGLVVGTAVMGKMGEIKGDSLDGFEPNLDEASIISHIQNPFTSNPQDILKKATTRIVYDLYQYKRSSKIPNSAPLPNVVYSLIRETHVSDLVASPTARPDPYQNPAQTSPILMALDERSKKKSRQSLARSLTGFLLIQGG